MELKDLDLNNVIAEKVSKTEVKLTANITLDLKSLIKEKNAVEATLASAKGQLAAQQAYVDTQEAIFAKYVALIGYAEGQGVVEEVVVEAPIVEETPILSDKGVVEEVAVVETPVEETTILPDEVKEVPVEILPDEGVVIDETPII